MHLIENKKVNSMQQMIIDSQPYDYRSNIEYSCHIKEKLFQLLF